MLLAPRAASRPALARLCPWPTTWTAFEWTRLFGYAFPLAFVVASWLAGAGFPFYLDNNETYLSYVHARNLEIWNPNEYGWLTAAGTDPTLPHTENVYTHMPNGSRYLHYLLLRAGVRDLPAQTLILGLLGTGLSVALLWRLFNHPALLVVPLAVVLDYPGFLAWTANSYRVWTFVLYFGLALAVVRKRPLWVGVLTFLAFQVDFGVALFVSATATVLALLMHRWQAWTLILAAVIGAGVSVAIFVGQVLSFQGWDGLVAEVAATYARRGTEHAPAGLGTFVEHAWRGLLLLAVAVAGETYNRVVALLLAAGVVAAPVLLRRPRLDEHQRFLATLLVATTAGAMATSTLLYGYFVDAFVDSLLPLGTFLIAPALGLIALELRRVLGQRWPTPHLAAVCGALVLVPLVVASASLYRPPIAVGLFDLLQHEYRGRAFVGPGYTAELAFALTGGRAASTGNWQVETVKESTQEASTGAPEPGPQRVPTLASGPAASVERILSLREADGAVNVVCLDPLYARHQEHPLAHDGCQSGLAELGSRVREVVGSGPGWVLARVDLDADALVGLHK